MIRDPDDPTADNDPFTVNRRKDEFACTTTPGSIVNVTPDATVTSFVITYGLFANVQVVFEEIVPETFVGPADSATAGDNNNAKTSTSANNHANPDRRRLLRAGAPTGTNTTEDPSSAERPTAPPAARPDVTLTDSARQYPQPLPNVKTRIRPEPRNLRAFQYRRPASKSRVDQRECARVDPRLTP